MPPREAPTTGGPLAAGGSGEGGRPQVLLALDHEPNREQVAAALAGAYDVREPEAETDTLPTCDLVLVDERSFGRLREAIAVAQRAAAPVVIPTLLVLTDHRPADLPAETWDVVDDVIQTPIRRVELQGRVRALYRTRQYARSLARENERLEEFADVLAHDLRNPLTIAWSSLETARAKGDPAAFDRAERGLTRMRELVDDVLALARTGRVVETTTPVRVTDLVSTAWETVATPAAELVVDVPPETMVECDETRTVTLFENLFRNAVTHGGEGVTVRVACLADDVGIAVADDGTGIAERDREQVFESGYSTAPDGTGFGLAIVEAIASAHGWTVTLTDADSGGARFELRWEPAGEPPQAGVGGVTP